MPTTVERTVVAPLGGTWFEETPLVMGKYYRKWILVAQQERASLVTLTLLTHAKLTQNMVSGEYDANWMKGHSLIMH